MSRRLVSGKTGVWKTGVWKHQLSHKNLKTLMLLKSVEISGKGFSCQESEVYWVWSEQ